MANGQYTIPQNAEQPQSAAVFSSQLDVLQYTPESQPQAFASLKTISERLDSYRTTAVAIEQKNRPWLKAATAFIITPKPILAELIEKESIVIGKLVQKQYSEQQNRVWVQDGDLFYGYVDKKNNISLHQTTIHYEFDNNEPKKSFQGKRVPFVAGESDNLAQLIPLIEPTVLHELYTVDEALQELKKEDFRLAA